MTGTEPALSQWLVDTLGIIGGITAIAILGFLFIILPLLIINKLAKKVERNKHHE